MNRTRFSKSSGATSDVRPSPIAGQWYPGTPDRLRARVQGFLDAADVEPLDGQLVGLVAPHAGHTYSGSVAAHAYKLVEGAHYDVVAIVAPNHRIPNSAPYLITAHGAYWTPLGEVLVADELVAALDARLSFTRIKRDEEHSLEIQLPFLQVALAEQFRILPVMLNDQAAETCFALGEALAALLSNLNALLIASTDLSHFYDSETAARLDGAVTDCIAAFNAEELLRILDSGKGKACGGGPTVAVMKAARALGANRARLLNYATSGDVTGDYHSVVGYAAAALFKSEP